MDEMEDFDQNHDSIVQILLTCGYFAGGTATLLIVISLIIRWIRQPEWRTPQAFITLTDLVIGTIVTCTNPLVIEKIADIFGISMNYRNIHPVFLIANYLSLFTNCWSLCLPVVVYKQLVRIDKPIKHVKVIATVFSVGAFILWSLALTGLQYYVHNVPFLMTPLMFSGLLFMNILVYIYYTWKVSRSETLKKRDSEHTLTLVKVVLMTKIVMFVLGVWNISSFYFHFQTDYMRYFNIIVMGFHRLPLAIAVLRSKATKTYGVLTDNEEDLKTSL